MAYQEESCDTGFRFMVGACIRQKKRKVCVFLQKERLVFLGRKKGCDTAR